MPKVRLTQHGFPQTATCRNTQLRTKTVTTAPNLTHLLEGAADYWNEAQRLKYEELNQTVPEPLIEVVTNATDVRKDDVRVGICSCDDTAASGWFVHGENIICLDEKKGINIDTCTHESGHALGLGLPHPDAYTPSVMTDDSSTRLMYERYRCNPPSPPFRFDIDSVLNTTSPEMRFELEGPYREVLSEQADITDFPTCRVAHPILLIALGFQKTIPNFVSGFLTGIVNEVLKLPSVKKLKHYESIKRIAKLLPNILFIILTIGLNGLNLTTFTALGVTISYTMIAEFLKNPCINKCLSTQNESGWKEYCFKLLTDPYMGLVLASIASSVSLSLTDLLRPEQSIPSTYTLETQALMSTISPFLGYVLGYASKLLAQAGFNVVHKKLNWDRYEKLQTPALKIVPTETPDAIAIQIDIPMEELTEETSEETTTHPALAPLKNVAVSETLPQADHPTIPTSHSLTQHHTIIQVDLPNLAED